MDVARESRRAKAPTGPFDGVVRAEALRLYREVVRDLGGDPEALLAQNHIDPDRLNYSDALISYRAMIQLLEQTAVELGRADFGLRLAARQGGIAVLGPLEVAMRNSSTVGEAYRYCAGHLQVYSPVVQIRIDADPRSRRHMMRFEILLDRIRSKRQTVENALCLTHHAVLTLSAGRFGAREVWFAHERGMPQPVYQKYFDCPVRFRRPFNAVFFNSSDLAQPIQDHNPRLYEMAATYIDLQYPSSEQSLVARVRLAVERLLGKGPCSHRDVARELGMHERTLQRRLRTEHGSFEDIKDEVRRDLAQRYLSETLLPVTRIAALLGYSESSVLSRSCKRWFDRSPRQIREAGMLSPNVRSVSPKLNT